MLRTFNLGVGLVVVCREKNADAVIETLRNAGEEAYVIGGIVVGSGQVKCSGQIQFSADQGPATDADQPRRRASTLGGGKRLVMIIDLVEASQSDAYQMESLLDKYLRELSTYREVRVGATEAATYRYLDAYWSEKGRHAFLIKGNDSVAGFALVRDPRSAGSGIHEIAEFYVKPEYRHQGAGRRAALAIWQRFPGLWELQVHAQNSAAAKFWVLCAETAATEAPQVSEVQASDGRRIQLNFNIQPTA